MIYLKYCGLLLLALFAACSQPDKPTSDKKEVIQRVVESTNLPPIPDSLLLCGQWIDLSGFEVKERLDREILSNAYFHSNTILYIKRANRYFPVIEPILKKHKLPDDLKYIAVIESGLNQAVSPSGAVGFWQFMEETGKSLGLRIDKFVDERKDIVKSTNAACNYLQNASSTFNADWVNTIASYNRGVHGLQQDLAYQNEEDYFSTWMNSETGRYVFRLMAVKLILESPAEYGFELADSELYEPIQTRKKTISGPIKDLAQWCDDNKVHYRTIRQLNPWIIGNKLPVGRFTIQFPIIDEK